MQQVDGGYIYRLGAAIHPLADVLGPQTWKPATYGDIFAPLFSVEDLLRGFLEASVFQPKYCQTVGQHLLATIGRLRDKVLTEGFDHTQQIEVLDHYSLTKAAQEFELLMATEFSQSPLYLVSKKGGYETATLIQLGEELFPPDLAMKVPSAIADARDAARCIAFELPTAVGFHAHRALEAVLQVYFDVVTTGASRPENSTLGTLLAELRTLRKGDPKVIAALKDIKDLHRNPISHPGDRVESVEDAINLLNASRAAIGYMLKEIPAAP